MMLSFSKSYAAFTVLHFVAFALALAVCGLYGHDLKRASDNDVDADSKWIYAVVVGALSAVTCVAYFVPFVLRLGGIVIPAWNFILFVLWTAVFGIFAKVSTRSQCQKSRWWSAFIARCKCRLTVAP